MNSEIDAGAMLATARARRKVVAARAHAQLARLGGETARRSVEFESLSEAENQRDGRMMRKVTRIWAQKRRKGISRVTLPSGRVIRYDHDANEVIRT